MKKQLIAFLILGIFNNTVYGQISGKVFDEHQTPLPGAHLLLLPDSLQTVSDEFGGFLFPSGIKAGKHQLIVHFVGYETIEKEIVISEDGKSETLNIQMTVKAEFLDAVIIKDEHAKQETTLSTAHVTGELIEENRQGTFAKSIEKLPGISAINVGVGIAKPVIRGLSSNRIIVNQQGIKQESHQWGADHGLEIDPFDVERVEIVKGPASLQYGSDGLGGVINIMPGHIVPTDSYSGSVEGLYKTNNQHWGGSAHLAANKNDYFIAARYSRQSFGDIKVPADQFTYNGFVLPIYNQRLKNTAGRENNIRLSLGKITDRLISRIFFSHYRLDAGLFAGAVGIPRSYALTDDGNLRDLDIPKQQANHLRVSFHQTHFWEEKHLDINLAYQKSLRKEFSFPEFHNIPSSQLSFDNTLALQLNLQTWSANVHYETHPKPELKTVMGANFQYQNNQRNGFEFLLPDFRTYRSGAFAIIEWFARDKWTFNGGLRLDYGNNRSDYYRQWIWDSNENIIDSLIAPLNHQTFFNCSASAGFNHHAGKQWWLRANIGKSFRVPYPAETVSNGIHHGTFRHELGTPGLQSEHGYQFDLSTDWQNDKLMIGFAGYFNYFKNYIYLGPTFPAKFSTLPEAGQIFQYRQDNALHTGFEWQMNWIILKGLSIEQVADFVQTYNPVTGMALPFTPQPALKHYLRYNFPEKHRLKNGFIELGHQYHFAAKGIYRIDRTEQETPAYQLWQLSSGFKTRVWKQNIQFNFQIQNLLNTYYLHHLSRYRLINVPEQGVNFVFGMKVPFGGDF